MFRSTSRRVALATEGTQECFMSQAATQLVAPSAVTIAVAIDAIICTINLIVSFLLIMFHVSCNGLKFREFTRTKYSGRKYARNDSCNSRNSCLKTSRRLVRCGFHRCHRYYHRHRYFRHSMADRDPQPYQDRYWLHASPPYHRGRSR